jgi:hypothetical protein
VVALPLRGATYITTTQAASLLGIDVAALRVWQERYGFPTPVQAQGRRELISLNEVLALRNALFTTHSATAAVMRARVTAQAATAEARYNA